MARELAQKSPASGRPKRQSLTTRNRLRIKNMDPNFVYRIVNDVEDRVEIMKDLGYEVVSADEVKVNDRRADIGAAIGTASTLALGQGMRGVVMRMPKEWYEDAQKEKMADVSRLEQTLKPKKSDGMYGSVEFSRD